MISLERKNKITPNRLVKLGFVEYNQRHEIPSTYFEKDDIKIWTPTGAYYIVDVFDQNGIVLELQTLGQLDDFFKGCRRKLL